MKDSIKLWSEVPETQLKELFLKNPYPPYRGTPLANDLMKEYMFLLAKENADKYRNNALVVLSNDKPVFAGQVYSIPYLSEYWGKSIGVLGHFVFDTEASFNIQNAATMLISELLQLARLEKIGFLSANTPAANITLVRAMEKNGFLYTEGFINMVGLTHTYREQFNVSNLVIREAVESDLAMIADAYSKVTFPNRFTNDGGFDPKKAAQLYVRRFKEVYEEKIGEIFVADFNEKFAGAIIAIIDDKMSKTIGVKTNILSGMGIIIHPNAARRGVSMALIEHRQAYYKSKGVNYVNFGANFTNAPMILGLTKLGLEYGSLDLTFHLWLR